MLGDMKQVFEMLEMFSGDMLGASIESAQAEAQAAHAAALSADANVRKLQKQKAAIAKFMVRYRADLAKTEKLWKKRSLKYRGPIPVTKTG